MNERDKGKGGTRETMEVGQTRGRERREKREKRMRRRSGSWEESADLCFRKKMPWQRLW
jgi:hypothetical protein